MLSGTTRQSIVVCIVALVTVVAFTMPVSALSGGDGGELDPGDGVLLPGDGTCFPGDAFLPAVQFPGDAFGGDGNDRLDTFPPGSVHFPGDTYAGTPASKQVCSK